MIVELLLVRHGYSCANAWSKKYKGIHLAYADPELTEEGKRLCEERKETLRSAIAKYFPHLPYIVATSAMIRTQQTAYHMLLKGTDTKYTIFPHVAEEGITPDNFPLSAEKQLRILGPPRLDRPGSPPRLDRPGSPPRLDRPGGPSVRGHLHEDLRGSTNLENKSNWPKFLAWLEKHDGPSRIVLFTHGRSIRTALKIPSSQKPHNNDIYYVKVNTETGVILEKKKLTEFPEPPVSVKGCRISTVSQYITGGTRKNRRTRRRQTYKRM